MVAAAFVLDGVSEGVVFSLLGEGEGEGLMLASAPAFVATVLLTPLELAEASE